VHSSKASTGVSGAGNGLCGCLVSTARRDGSMQKRGRQAGASRTPHYQREWELLLTLFHRGSAMI
jgi:hypothetical protein